jgi:glyoxylase-like metal-dependent hydrolase (beta-lactamase superfamily II)
VAPQVSALVFGDSLIAGPRVSETWVEEGASVEDYKETLRPLVDLPVELLLLTHGPPVVSDARSRLAAALASA